MTTTAETALQIFNGNNNTKESKKMTSNHNAVKNFLIFSMIEEVIANSNTYKTFDKLHLYQQDEENLNSKRNKYNKHRV